MRYTYFFDFFWYFCIPSLTIVYLSTVCGGGEGHSGPRGVQKGRIFCQKWSRSCDRSCVRSCDGSHVRSWVKKLRHREKSPIRNGTGLGLIYTCFYDSLWLFKHIFTDFENFRFVYTPLTPHFRHLFSLDRCEKSSKNRQTSSKIANRQNGQKII